MHGFLDSIALSGKALWHEEQDYDSNQAHDLKLQSRSFHTVATFVPRTYYSSVKNEHRSALTTHHSKITAEDRPDSHSEKHGAMEPACAV